MLFSEEMTTLSNRFRQVEFQIDTSSKWPTDLRNTWLEIEYSGSLIRFKNSAFTTPSETIAQIQGLFPSADDIGFEPLSLRSIFLANVRTHRNLHAQSESGVNA